MEGRICQGQDWGARNCGMTTLHFRLISDGWSQALLLVLYFIIICVDLGDDEGDIGLHV